MSKKSKTIDRLITFSKTAVTGGNPSGPLCKPPPGCCGSGWGGFAGNVITEFLCHHLAFIVADPALSCHNIVWHMRLRNMAVTLRIQFRKEVQRWQARKFWL